MFVTTARLERSHGLPSALARDIVVAGMQHALRRRWQPWARLFASLMFPLLATGAGWVPAGQAWHGGPGPVAVIAGCAGWALLGRCLGGEAMLAAAAAKARRPGRGSR